MNKNYMLGAVVALVFIFALYTVYSVFLIPVSFSPGGNGATSWFFNIIPVVVGFLIVALIFFLIKANYE